MTRMPVAALAAVLLLAVAGCSPGSEPERTDREVVVVSPPDPDAPRHTHGTVIGDGTTPRAAGYRMTEVTFPDSTDEPGPLTFRVLGPDGEVVRDYVEEQTKRLHLYVVRDDLTVFRHLHPELRADGTWTAYVDLAEPGRYRVVAEFVPAERPGGSHVVLASPVTLSGPDGGSPDVDPMADDAIVDVVGPAEVPVGEDEEMVLTVSDGDGGVLNLGTYLGAYAHLTGFEETTGAFVHVHPLGAPTTTEQGSELRFHTSFTEPGAYRFFAQVRVDGFVHTVPLTLRVGRV